MPKIPENKIEEVRQAADIVDVVSDYVTLKRSGQNYFGLCPFHQEKTPSFSVNPAKQIFYCFGCGAGGNVISFIMRIEKISFPEAVFHLARKYNISIPLEEENSEEARLKTAIYDANRFAAEFFHNHLLKTPSAQKARDYLKERGFSQEMIEKFNLGWSLESWDGLIQAAKKKGISEKILKAAGLVLANERGGTYDRFRGRLMFPIYQTSGVVVGFGGRILDKEAKTAKYLNTSDTPVFQKGRILYGLYQNREAIRKEDQAILVEGYADLITLVQFGIENVVASSGTALTENQANLLMRMTRNVVLLYDGDLAGAHAALRGVDTLVKTGLRVSVVALPPEHDPDSYVREFGAEKLRNLIKTAQDLIDFKIFAYRSEKSLDIPQNKTELLHQIAGTIAKISDEVLRNLYGQRVAAKLNLPERIVFREISASQRQEKASPEAPVAKIGDNLSKSASFLAERDLIRIAVEHAEMLPFIFQNLTLDEFGYPGFRRIFQMVFQHYQRNEEIQVQELFDSIENPDVQALLAKVNFEETEEISEKDLRLWAEDCVATIKLAEIRRQIDEVRQAMRQAQMSGGADLTALNQKYLELKQKELAIRQHDFIEKEKDTDDVPF